MPRLPSWLHKPTGLLGELHEVKALLRASGLHTVCESARCPNIGECFKSRTATFLLLGECCTRRCAFCAVRKGRPSAPAPHEPDQVARAAASLGLRHVVLTMVTRDDLPDGGASQVAATVRAVRRVNPGATIEVLISDLGGSAEALAAVLESGPDVLNHNMETVPRLYAEVRPQADYGRSIALIRSVARLRPGCVVKSGLMVGLGETGKEILDVFTDLHEAGCTVVTVGQYLRPVRTCLPVARFWTPSEFEELEQQGRALGLAHVVAGPFVRSSFNAGQVYARTARGRP